MAARHLAVTEPLLDDAVLLLVLAGSMVELGLSFCLLWALFGGG